MAKITVRDTNVTPAGLFPAGDGGVCIHRVRPGHLRLRGPGTEPAAAGGGHRPGAAPDGGAAGPGHDPGGMDGPLERRGQRCLRQKTW